MALSRRVRQRLREEQVIWFTAVAGDGTPQPNPVWFLWDGSVADHILLYTRPDARRLAYIRERPRVALHFNANDRGGDVVVFTGEAWILDDVPPPHENPGYLDKYRRGMLRVSGSLDAFGADYSVPVGVRITRVRGS